MTRHPCPCCGSSHCQPFYEAEGVPADIQLPSRTREEAIALPRGTVALEFCSACGFIFNGAFDPDLVACRRLSAQSYSRFSIPNTLHHALEGRVIEHSALRDILKREFPDLLSKLGANDGSGFDARSPPQSQSLPGGIDGKSVGELLEPTTAPIPGLVLINNCLQNVAEPVQVLKLLGGALHDDARLLVVVSNFIRSLRSLAFWDIHYPHRSYFSPGTLHRLLRSQGFAVRDIWTDVDAEYLIADARTATTGATDSGPRGPIDSIADLAGLVARFADECGEKQALWCEILRNLAGDGNRIAIWGADSKAASFLTTLAVGDEVSYVVDANPCRQGRFTPGTGHRIVAPDVLVSLPPDVVIVLNSVITSEIIDQLVPAGCAPPILIA